MIDKLLTGIHGLATDEKSRADTEHGPIKSNHEGFGVLAEEVLELDKETKPIPGLMERLLDGIMREDDVLIRNALHLIQARARNAAAEAIQVVSVCERALECMSGNKDDGD